MNQRQRAAAMFLCSFLLILGLKAGLAEKVTEEGAAQAEQVLKELEPYLKNAADKADFLESLQEYPGWLNAYDMELSSRETVDKLNEIYGELEGREGFTHPSMPVFDFYGEQYRKLLKSEVSYYDLPNHQLKTLEEVKFDLEILEEFSNGGVMIDMNRDAQPELYIRDLWHTYIFKYYPDAERYFLWWETNGGNGRLCGEGKILDYIFESNTNCLYQLDQEGKEIYRIDFSHPLLKAYLVTLPVYDGSYIKKEDVTEEMKTDGYLDMKSYHKGEEWVYFRVTKEEFEELTDRFLDRYYASDEEAYEILSLDGE